MIGNFDIKGTGQYNNLGYDKFEGKQKEAMLEVMNFFGNKYGFSNIVFHNELSGKTCPGTGINKSKFISEAKKFGKKEDYKLKDIDVEVHGHSRKVKAIVYEGNNYVPVRFLEQLGYEVGWKNKKVTINYNRSDK